MGQVYSHLSEDERLKIQGGLSQGWPIRKIACEIGRSASTVSREIRRNTWFPSNDCEAYRPYRPAGLKTDDWTGRYYVAHQAQKKAHRRRIKPRKPHAMSNDKLHAYVCEGLRRGWSPLLISGMLKTVFPDDVSMRICPETIYVWIYSKKTIRERWAQYLPRAHKRRRKKNGRKVGKHRPIAYRVSISKRGNHINNRSEFGHWEADLVLYKGRHVLTLVERKTRYMMAWIIPNKTAYETLKALITLLILIPCGACRSITFDNGGEFAQHYVLQTLFGITTYFAHPYSSWERGTNENRNGILRRYLPKKTDITDLTQEELAEITHDINTRPMKLLNYHTPHHQYQTELAKLDTTTHRCTYK